MEDNTNTSRLALIQHIVPTANDNIVFTINVCISHHTPLFSNFLQIRFSFDDTYHFPCLGNSAYRMTSADVVVGEGEKSHTIVITVGDVYRFSGSNYPCMVTDMSGYYSSKRYVLCVARMCVCNSINFMLGLLFILWNLTWFRTHQLFY